MTGNELIELFRRHGKRCHVIGNSDCGIIAGLDLEGRLYTLLDGRVVSRVNPAAVAGISTRRGYLNPGGDGLWPAPEGTAMGYQYATGSWRVPPGLTGARFLLTEDEPEHGVIEAEIDLINARGVGIPTLFRRDVTVVAGKTALTVKTVETIRYLGAKKLGRDEMLLAPWSLCQFDCGPGCETVFPADGADIWDLYEPGGECRRVQGDMMHCRTDSSLRYQIGIGRATPWIEFRRPADRLTVRRSALPLPPEQSYIDIADAPPEAFPANRDTRYSVYSDTGGFMEIEAVGGCPAVLEPEQELSVAITTKYSKG
jgi:hypothetical protein